MDEKEEVKNCANCKFFSPYYFIFKEKLKKAGCGACINGGKKVTAANSRVTCGYTCGLWQPAKMPPRDDIKNKLQTIAAQLRDIALILKGEE